MSERRKQEDQHIANLERLGWEHMYSYSPGDRKGKRHVFADPGGTTVVFLGLDALYAADVAAYGQAKREG